jgi:ABC-2 type transport system ATP-binding protein
VAILEISGLTKSFGELRAVQQVDFEVREGEIYGLLGPNGAGKTTTISMISGLLKPDAGKVAVAGNDFWSDSEKSQRVMGVVPQDIALYEEISGRENLKFWGRLAGLPSGDAKIRSKELLEALSLSDRGNDPVKVFRRHETSHQSRLRAHAQTALAATG